jgi:hypothetical protein
MQTLICSFIIGIAVFYLVKRWLPGKIKKRLRQTSGRSSNVRETAGSCGSCSSCGDCANDVIKVIDINKAPSPERAG